jgi:hypothetical protein
MTRPSRIRNSLSFNSFGFRALCRYFMMKHPIVWAQILQSRGLTKEDLLFGTEPLAADDQAQLWGLACQLRQDDTLSAFRAALLHDLHDSGLVGILSRSCSSLEEMFVIHRNYLTPLDAEGVLAVLEERERTVSYVFPKFFQVPHFIQEYALAATWVALHSIVPTLKDFHPVFELPGTAADRGLTDASLEEIRKDYGAIVEWGSARVAFTLDRAVARAPVPTADPNLKLLLERKLRIMAGGILSEDTEELRSQVFTALWELSRRGSATQLGDVAEYLGVREQALTSALRSSGVSFQKLKAILTTESSE